MSRPIGIDLFAGAGGLSLGFEQAGFDIVAAVEIDPVHAATHHFNFPNCIIIPKSIVGLSGRKLREIANIGNRRIDVVFGGAPCQGFSLMGQRALGDPRNELVKEFVRLVAELDAKYFVFENVKGLTIGKHRIFLDELIEAFGMAGYEVLTPWKVLNAYDYGVPQDRTRLFLIGAQKGYRLPKYPDDSSLRPTCFQALGDLPDAESFEELQTLDYVHTDKWGTASGYAREMRCLDNDAWHYGYQRMWDRNILTSSRRTKHTEISRRRFANALPGSVEPISRFFKLSEDGVSNTLRAGTDSARGAFTSPRPIHFAFARCITVREMARLHGFPDWFRFHGTIWHGARQIGNAVPPPLARAVGGEIISALGIESNKPSDLLSLGQIALVYMDMSEAAKHWGVPIPIGKRDKKSGARKRKQEEIEALRLKAEAREVPHGSFTE
jgi:DNA (cytosine-5)-methyltransferase 1